MKIVLLAATKVAWSSARELFRELGYDCSDSEAGVYTDAETVMEFAGRTCYKSYRRPNPATANPADFVRSLIEKGHLSVLEHAGFTVGAFGVSRALTHELVRHRHLSFSQVSQRYVYPSDRFIVPPLFEGNAEAIEVIERHYKASLEAYKKLEDLARVRAGGVKSIREAARIVLPNSTSTDIVVSGNHRAWREFIMKRYTSAADREIQEFAGKVLQIGRILAPSVYEDIVYDRGVQGKS